MPRAPNSLAGLFEWADRNSKILLKDSERKTSFSTLASATDIVITDFFAGSGNGSTSLKQQYMAMTSNAGYPYKVNTYD